MKETNSIVVPVDFLETSDKLIEYAVYMAGKLSAVTHFIHVVHFYESNAMLGLPYAQECEDRLLANAEERMANLVADNSERSTGCTGEVVIGDPVDEITAFAKAKNSDLIIISTHGAKGLEKILLGSVTKRVLKRAHCPVLVMKPFKK
ncbi:MAG: universal stress protein [Desulfobulbaceae bacterium]|nr:universal stress protein [Desulfobulbaceae bacterium]